MQRVGGMILPEPGRGTIRRRANGGGGGSLRKPAVYAARKLRQRLSLPEAILWKQLSSEKLGFRCRKQHPIGPYIVDFYVSCARLVVEIDGEAHDRGDRPVRDERRDAYMLNKDYQLLRIPAVEVLNNMEGVLQAIAAASGRPLHHPSDGPPPRPGEDL
jgi:very-short-patch-repair endonuclease